jgi:hypothetical protein
MATSLMPDFKNGDVVDRLQYVAIQLWWISCEGRLARLTIMNEVSMGSM